MKDYFSKQSDFYSQYRPGYPVELYEFVFSFLNGLERAWDCATGNGQVADELQRHFETVYATDISQAQLNKAMRRPGVLYKVLPAENCGFPANFFDLVTVAQALHWFQFEEFFAEILRVIKNGGVFATWGYELLRIDAETDKLILDFYNNTTGPYWAEERKHVESRYETIPFPFESMQEAAFESRVQWKPEHLEGYLNSWSAIQKYKEVKDENPVVPFMKKIREIWPENEVKEAIFPVFLRLAVVEK